MHTKGAPDTSYIRPFQPVHRLSCGPGAFGEYVLQHGRLQEHLIRHGLVNPNNLLWLQMVLSHSTRAFRSGVFNGTGLSRKNKEQLKIAFQNYTSGSDRGQIDGLFTRWILGTQLTNDETKSLSQAIRSLEDASNRAQEAHSVRAYYSSVQEGTGLDVENKLAITKALLNYCPPCDQEFLRDLTYRWIDDSELSSHEAASLADAIHSNIVGTWNSDSEADAKVRGDAVEATTGVFDLEATTTKARADESRASGVPRIVLTDAHGIEPEASGARTAASTETCEAESRESGLQRAIGNEAPGHFGQRECESKSESNFEPPEMGSSSSNITVYAKEAKLLAKLYRDCRAAGIGFNRIAKTRLSVFAWRIVDKDSIKGRLLSSIIGTWISKDSSLTRNQRIILEDAIEASVAGEFPKDYAVETHLFNLTSQNLQIRIRGRLSSEVEYRETGLPVVVVANAYLDDFRTRAEPTAGYESSPRGLPGRAANSVTEGSESDYKPPGVVPDMLSKEKSGKPRIHRGSVRRFRVTVDVREVKRLSRAYITCRGSTPKTDLVGLRRSQLGLYLQRNPNLHDAEDDQMLRDITDLWMSDAHLTRPERFILETSISSLYDKDLQDLADDEAVSAVVVVSTDDPHLHTYERCDSVVDKSSPTEPLPAYDDIDFRSEKQSHAQKQRKNKKKNEARKRKHRKECQEEVEEEVQQPAKLRGKQKAECHEERVRSNPRHAPKPESRRRYRDERMQPRRVPRSKKKLPSLRDALFDNCDLALQDYLKGKPFLTWTVSQQLRKYQCGYRSRCAPPDTTNAGSAPQLGSSSSLRALLAATYSPALALETCLSLGIALEPDTASRLMSRPRHWADEAVFCQLVVEPVSRPPIALAVVLEALTTDDSSALAE
ncbi:hypothetical protein B0A49_05776 [Cryomyces minteri]|uniref:Uncharacterized protein n=1 Tax=Cryomyces minteri TaxID=331657 RepID=A0A4U0WTL7_9PEZI|nr:hypothetical protein B0A49_05776 [Cryomyces minteri]